MKIEKYQVCLIGGIGMIVGAFFAAAKALGGAVALIYFFVATDFSSVEPSVGENLTYSMMTGQIAGAIHGIASFLILFFGGRWLISGPELIHRWSERAVFSTDESNKPSKMDAPPGG